LLVVDLRLDRVLRADARRVVGYLQGQLADLLTHQDEVRQFDASYRHEQQERSCLRRM